MLRTERFVQMISVPAGPTVASRTIWTWTLHKKPSGKDKKRNLISAENVSALMLQGSMRLLTATSLLSQFEVSFVSGTYDAGV